MVAGAVVVADGAARLDGVGDQALVGVFEGGDVGGPGDGGVGRLLVAELPVEGDVVGDVLVQLGSPLCLGGDDDVDDGVEGLVVDLDELGRVPGLLAGLGDDDGDGIADVAHLADRQRRMRRLLHGVAVLEVDLPAGGQSADAVGGHLLAVEDGDDAVGRGRCRGVDPPDVGQCACGDRTTAAKVMRGRTMSSV